MIDENSSSLYSEILSLVLPLVKTSGNAALALQENLFEVHDKGYKDIVTQADLESEKILTEGITKLFPTHAIRTEESGNILQSTSSEFLWLIDPLDGTVNFSRGLPLWGVSLALLRNFKPVLSLCFLPSLFEMYSAVFSLGAYLENTLSNKKRKLSVSSTLEMERAIVSNGDFNVGDMEKIHRENLNNFSSEAKSCLRVKCMGSAVTEGCFLSAGRLDAFVMTMSYPWDIAGISLLVSEAGGCASRLDGAPLTYSDGEQALFTNGLLHEKFIGLLKK